jgi:hypothetical protein
MRARSEAGGFEFMPRPCDSYYKTLPSRIVSASCLGWWGGAGGVFAGAGLEAALRLSSPLGRRACPAPCCPPANPHAPRPAGRANPPLPPKGDSLTAEQYAAVEELGILVDKDDQGVLLQIFTKPLGDRWARAWAGGGGDAYVCPAIAWPRAAQPFEPASSLPACCPDPSPRPQSPPLTPPHRPQAHGVH